MTAEIHSKITNDTHMFLQFPAHTLKKKEYRKFCRICNILFNINTVLANVALWTTSMYFLQFLIPVTKNVGYAEFVTHLSTST